MINEKKLKDGIENEIRWLQDQRHYTKTAIELFVLGIRKVIKEAEEDEENGEV